MLEGETLGASLTRFVKSYDCLFSYCGVFLETEGDLTWFSHTFASRGTDGYLQTALASPGAMINIMRHYAGPSFWPTMVHLDIPKPARTTDIEAHLPFDIIYDAPRFGIAFPRHLLSLRRIAGRPEAPISLSEVRRRTSPARAQTVLDAVAETVRLQIGSGRPSLDATARMLGMNTRTLRRAMDSEGVTYRELSRRMMLDTARELLVETDMPLSDVAQAAGYADQFSFSRAYYEAYGQRPSWLRQSA